MIVERIDGLQLVTCDRCRRAGVPGWTAVLHESDRGQHVYAIKLNLTLSLCYSCTPQPPSTP